MSRLRCLFPAGHRPLTGRGVFASGVCLTLGLASVATPALAKGPDAGGHSDSYVFYNDWSGEIDQEKTVGTSTDQIFSGDWDGNGTTSLGRRSGSVDTIYDDANANIWQSDVFWEPGDAIVTGDWDGDGKTSFGVHSGSEWFLRNELGNGAPDYKFTFGTDKDLVLVGDPDGEGKDAIVLRQGTNFMIHYADATSTETKTFAPAELTEVVALGDWDGNGTDTPLVRKENTYYAYNSWDSSAAPAEEMTVGGARNAVLVGDWDGDGKDTMALRNYEKPATGGQISTASTTAVTVSPVWRLRADAAASWERVIDTLGENFPLSSAWRSYDTQKMLFEQRYTPKSHGGGEFCDVRTWDGTRYVRTSDLGAAAVPGTSNHGKGQAIDVPGFESFGDPARLEFLRVAKDFGWDDKEGCSVNERWHFTYNPADDKGYTTWKPGDPVDKNVSHCPDKVIPTADPNAPAAKPQCEP